MLNLTIGMRLKHEKTLYLIFIIIISTSLGKYHRVNAQTQSPTSTASFIQITNPLPGSAIQGMIQIIGQISVEDFANYAVEFSYQDNPQNTWFLINQSEEAILNGVLAVWDTSQISDGEYQIRIVLHQQNGNITVNHIPNIRVRNYSAIETDTPIAATQTAHPIATITPVSSATIIPTTSTPPATSTPGASNPAQISNDMVIDKILQGVGMSIGLFIILGIYQRLRALNRKRFIDE